MSDKTKPQLNERFADNGEHSHWELIAPDGVMLWTEDVDNESEDSHHVSPPSLPTAGAKELEDWLHKTMEGRHILNQITFPIANHFKTHPEKIPNELVITLFRILESFAHQAPQGVDLNKCQRCNDDLVIGHSGNIACVNDDCKNELVGIMYKESKSLDSTPQVSEEELKIKAKEIYISYWKDWVEETFDSERPDTIDFKEDGGSYEHIIKAMIEFLNCASPPAPQVSEEEIEDWLESEAPYNLTASHIYKWLKDRDKLTAKGQSRVIGLKQALTAVDQWLNSDDTWVTDWKGNKIKGLIACKPGAMTKKFVENMGSGQHKGKESGWIKCSDRLPTEKDSNKQGAIVALFEDGLELEVNYQDSGIGGVIVGWKPTK